MAISTTTPRTASVILTNAQIKTLMTTGVEVVPAPGAAKKIQPLAVYMAIRKSSVYTNVNAAADVWVEYTGGGLATSGPGTTDGHLVFDADTTPQQVEQTINVAAEGPVSDYENLPLQVKAVNSAGAFTGGALANSLTVSVTYLIIDT